MDFSERFATNLVRLRQEAGLSRDGLALQSSIKAGLIDSFEAGRALPRIEEAIQLAGALGVPIDALSDGIEWRPGPGEFDITDR